jgi:hypothetical protein
MRSLIVTRGLSADLLNEAARHRLRIRKFNPRHAFVRVLKGYVRNYVETARLNRPEGRIP